MNILRQSTAVDVLIGPFLDITDGVTAEVGETPAIKLSKNGQALAAKNDATVPVHDADGYHNCVLDATDTNTTGTLVLTAVGTATALPIRHDYQVIDALAYDTLYADTPTILTGADIGLVYESTIGTVNTQTSFTTDVTFPVDDGWLGCEVSLEDVSTGIIYSGGTGSGNWCNGSFTSTNNIVVHQGFQATVVPGDILRIYARQNPAYALEVYDPPTRTEATADTASILAKLLAYVRLMTRGDAGPITDDAAELAAINADEGSGAGDFAPVTDSQEATADKLPAALSNGTIDANIVRVTDVAITGTGTSIDPWNP